MDEVATMFRQARGERADEDWARSAAARLMLDGVREPLVRDGLVALVPVIEESQEPATTLFGSPVEWAQERHAAWRSDGVHTTRPSGPASVGEFVHGVSIGAAIAAPILALLQMMADGWVIDFTLALVAFPLLISLGILGFPAAWNWCLRRRTRGATIAIAVVSLIGYSSVVAGILYLAHDVVLWNGSGFWMFAVATGYAILASLTRRAWPASDPKAPDEYVEDDSEWKRSLAAYLRERDDIQEFRIQAIIDDAETHSAESGKSLQEEFGAPASYATRFAPRLEVSTRRRAWAWTMLLLPPIVVFLLYGLEDGWHWQNRFLPLVLWFLAAVFMAATTWRQAIQHSRDHT
ncbi:hypothetical protein [Nesterenkonia xinjiangensis]|uniref:Drug/metabolite transporter (DMT)-like permease n=1 Tax=Nesterenkonia xinjiangensis TaxID=225327 RepID=A0A7Z0GLT2_9MICC|nr:hypothetical protein [Nesterenkonia xinjiangensis]NYJ77218.1 drug/metabolite transporter (DMT)-like permease [Nesterenkonia xinjiangensis]